MTAKLEAATRCVASRHPALPHGVVASLGCPRGEGDSAPRHPGIDLDELVLVSEAGDAEQRRGWNVPVEELGHDAPRVEPVLVVTNDVDGEVMDVTDREPAMLSIDVYGGPDRAVVERLREKAEMLGSGIVRVHDLQNGFARI